MKLGNMILKFINVKHIKEVIYNIKKNIISFFFFFLIKGIKSKMKINPNIKIIKIMFFPSFF